MTTAELRSLDDLHRYSQELAGRRVENDPAVRRLHVAKRITWMFLIAGSFLFYHLLDKMHEALSILR